MCMSEAFRSPSDEKSPYARTYTVCAPAVANVSVTELLHVVPSRLSCTEYERLRSSSGDRDGADTVIATDEDGVVVKRIWYESVRHEATFVPSQAIVTPPRSSSRICASSLSPISAAMPSTWMPSHASF